MPNPTLRVCFYVLVSPAVQTQIDAQMKYPPRVGDIVLLPKQEDLRGETEAHRVVSVMHTPLVEGPVEYDVQAEVEPL